MCRLYGFIATEPTKVECSLIRAQNALLKQSRLDSRGFRHPDGWGIAYYVDALPVVERRSGAAYEDLRFDAAAKLVHARIVVAHVRAASVGVPSTANTHPFQLGRWVFAHNGTIRRFEKVGPRLEASTEAAGLLRYRRGTTDSELAFLWILGRIRRVARGGLEGYVPVEQMVRAVQDALLSIENWCRDEGATEAPSLNFPSDGRKMPRGVAPRKHGLLDRPRGRRPMLGLWGVPLFRLRQRASSRAEAWVSGRDRCIGTDHERVVGGDPRRTHAGGRR